MKYEYISRAVRKLKKKYGTGDVRELCGALKIVINPVPMGTGRTAVKGFFIRSARVKVITINSDLPEIVRRFILAHELGHAVLHGSSGCNTFHDVTLYDDSSETEKEANLFAAELLMNDEDVLDQINNDGTFNALLDKREMHSQDNLMYAPLSKKHSSDMTSLYHMRTFDNILYKVTGTTVEKCGYFDFLNPPSASRLLNLSTYDMDLLMINPSLGPQTSDYLFLSAWVDKQFTQFIYNKNTGICTRYDSHGTGWGYTPIPIGASGNILITKITPSEAQFALERGVSESDKPMIQAIASQENDALLLYYLKDTD